MARNLRRRALTALAAGASLALLAGCATGGTDDSGGGDGSADGKTIAFIGYGDVNPWGAAFNNIYRPALEAEGVTIQDMSTMDAGAQVQSFNQAIADQPDAIVVALLDTAAMVAPMQKAIQAGTSAEPFL